MSRIEEALEKANKKRHSIEKSIAEETNEAEYAAPLTKKMSIMSKKYVLIGLILSAIVASVLLFSIINYFVLKTPQHVQPQRVQSQGSVQPKQSMPLNGMEDTGKEIQKESPQPQKPLKTIFTIQAGAFRNALYAKALATRLEKKGYKVYIKPIEEKDGGLFKVCVGNFSTRQEAERLSGEIKKTEDHLQTFVTLY